ncbi:MAG: DegT/DnrJ/EryC1/StrS family aminotransferase [Pseudomonadota bacterium]|nr:DegT/DnrJ/EryC1/StrS family aminotransferase [Pseudomonadota bacterium]
MNIPFIDLKTQYRALEKPINERIQNVLNHGQYIMGPEVAECEKALSDYVGIKHTITCGNGTDAILMVMMALGIKPGDEVITTGFSFFAAAEMISLAHAVPIFVDIDPKTYNLDPLKLEAAITPKTKLIIPVSLFGQPADCTAINKIAEKHKIPVMEDAAQSFGGELNGKKSGNLTTVSTTSFFPAKPLGCYGDGGAIFTSDDSLANILKQIRTHGDASRYEHVRIGLNGRMDTLQCAILIEKLKRFPWEVNKRHEIAMRFTEAFIKQEKKLNPPVIMKGAKSVYAQYTLWVEDRSAFQNKLKEKGIPTSIHYPRAIHHQEAYREVKEKFRLPHCEDAARGVISLPMYPDMSWETQKNIIDAVLSAI